MKITAFAASSSLKSINKRLVEYASTLLSNTEIQVLDLNDFELPIFSQDLEEKIGQPSQAHDFIANIADSEGLIISFAEHNGNYSAAYKNIFDWASRINAKVYEKKPVVIMSATPGKRGGQSVLSIASSQLPFFGAEVVGSFSLPNFYDHFDLNKGCITDDSLDKKLRLEIMKLSQRLEQ